MAEETTSMFNPEGGTEGLMPWQLRRLALLDGGLEGLDPALLEQLTIPMEPTLTQPPLAQQPFVEPPPPSPVQPDVPVFEPEPNYMRTGPGTPQRIDINTLASPAVAPAYGNPTGGNSRIRALREASQNVGGPSGPEALQYAWMQRTGSPLVIPNPALPGGKTKPPPTNPGVPGKSVPPPGGGNPPPPVTPPPGPVQPQWPQPFVPPTNPTIPPVQPPAPPPAQPPVQPPSPPPVTPPPVSPPSQPVLPPAQPWQPETPAIGPGFGGGMTQTLEAEIPDYELMQLIGYDELAMSPYSRQRMTGEMPWWLEEY